MTAPSSGRIVTTTPITPPDVRVEVAHRPLPMRMRLHRIRHPRPHLPSFPATALGVPTVGVTALTTMLVRDRRRAAG